MSNREGNLEKIKTVEERRSRLLKGGSAKAIDDQHKRTKLTARERVEKLFDKGTFREIDLWIRPLKTGFDIDERELPGDAVITGTGTVQGRPAYAYSHDYTVAGGTFGSALHHKVTQLMKMALKDRVPCVQIVDSGGERVHDRFGRPGGRPVLDGATPIGGASRMYHMPIQASGVIPQITLMLGPMYAGSAYVPTMADFMIMRRKTSFMSVASPSLLKSVTFIDVTQEEIGDAEIHGKVTGTVDFLTDTDDEAIKICRNLLTYLPLNNTDRATVIDTGDDPARRDEKLLEIVSPDLSTPYDMHEIIHCIFDHDYFIELQGEFARSIIIGLARLNGQTVGVVANNPAVDGGVLTLDTCDKEARFIRWCDAFNVPLVFLVDTKGFESGAEQEKSRDGLLRTVPKPVFAICEATVPMVSINIGRCFGVGRMIMGTTRMGIDLAYSWPSAQVARIDPAVAVDRIYSKELAQAADPVALRQQKLGEIRQKYMNFPFHAAEQVMVNDIIDPRDTRPVLVETLRNLANKQVLPRHQKKHSLAPQ